MARTLVGVVKSSSSDKTIVVNVDRRIRHKLYNKPFTISKKYSVHDETNQARVGDKVQIEETRPISKTKHWNLVSIIERPESLEENSK